MMSLAPIILFTYNRLDCLKKAVDALLKNPLASESELFIFSDGVKPGKDSAAVFGVRTFIHTIQGFRKIRIIEAPVNRGLAESVITGVTQVLDQYGKVIVLEDDLVTAPGFLTWMNSALDRYEDCDEVASVHGYTPPEITGLPDFYFLRFCSSWGWGTWSRAWKIFERDTDKLLAAFQDRRMQFEFNFGGAYPFYEMLCAQQQGKIDSWAIRWIASVFLSGKLALYPGENLISNFGYDIGTHYSNTGKIPESVSEKNFMIPEKRPDPLLLEHVWMQFHIYYAAERAKWDRNKRGFLFRMIKFLAPHGVVQFLKKRWEEHR